MAGSIFCSDIILSGVPATLNFQALAKFPISQETLICNDENTNVFTITIQGSSVSLGPQEKLKIPGSIWEITFNGTGHGRIFATDTPGQLPEFNLSGAGGGGGGGGGAPTTAPYLLVTATPVGALGSAVLTGAMANPLNFVLDSGGQPDNSILFPVNDVIDWGGGNVTPNGGIGHAFICVEGAGTHDFGTFQFVRTASGTQLQVLGYLDTPMFGYDPAVGGGFTMFGASDLRVAAANGNDLVLESNGAGVRVKSNGHEVVRFTNAHMDADTASSLTIGASSGHDLTLLNGGHNGGININDDATTPIQIQTTGGAWGFRTDGKLSIPSNAGLIGTAITVDSTGTATFKGSGTTTLESTAGVTQIFGQTNVTLGSNGTLGASAVTSATFSGSTTTTIGSTTSSGDTTLQVGGAKSAILQLNTGNLILSTAVVTGLAAGVNPSDSVNFSQLGGLHDLFTSGQISITGGSGTGAAAVGSAFNGKQAVVTLQSAGGAICTTPCIFQAAVSGATLTINMIDAVLGTPVVASTNLVLAYIVCAY